MFTAYIVVAAVLAAIVLMSARGKLTRDERVVQGLGAAKVPDSWFRPLAAAETAGGAGLLAGIAWRPLGVAAAIGLVLYFVGAVAAHLRARDTKGLTAPVPILALAVAALVLAIASA